MKSRRFFARLWRVNAILIFLFGLLACIGAVMVLVEIYSDSRRSSTTNVVRVGPGEAERSTTRLGVFEKIQGVDVLRAPLHVEQESGLGSKDGTSVQNYLFYDPARERSYWLVSGPPGLFVSSHELPEREYGSTTAVAAVLYAYVSKDMNGDGKLSDEDLMIIALSDADGRRFGGVLKDVSELHTSHLQGTRLVVVYTAADKLRVAHIDLTTRQILRDAPMQPS